MKNIKISCIIIIVMMMMMIFDTLQITVVALDGCYKFFKNRRTYIKKKESSAFLKCNSTVYCCVYMYSMEWFFWTIRYIRNGGKRLIWFQWICILPGVLEHSKTFES